jgi:hypothetical protein
MIPFEMIAEAPNLLATAQSIIYSLEKIAPIILETATKITLIAIPILQSLYTIGFGIAAMIIGLKSRGEAENLHQKKEDLLVSVINPPQADRLRGRITRHNESSVIGLFSGLLFIAAGVIGTAFALNELGVIDWAAELEILTPIGASMFLAGCLLSLYHYVQQLITFTKHLKEEGLSEEEREYSRKMIIAAIVGIVANLGYCFVGTSAILGFVGAATFAVGAAAMLIGTSRALYEALAIKAPEITG